MKKRESRTSEELRRLKEETSKIVLETNTAYHQVLNLGKIIDVIFDELPEEITKPIMSKIGEKIKMEQHKKIATLENQLEEAMIEKDIINDNKLDLKKVAEYDPKGKLLESLKKTNMIKKYKLLNSDYVKTYAGSFSSLFLFLLPYDAHKVQIPKYSLNFFVSEFSII